MTEEIQAAIENERLRCAAIVIDEKVYLGSAQLGVQAWIDLLKKAIVKKIVSGE